MKPLHTILLISFFALSFGACKDDFDNFSSNPNLSLSFSTDTLRFDTLFTEMGSPTKRIMVYNRHAENLKIQSVDLMGGASSLFRMNVDGEAGNNIKDVILRKGDSLSLFVETTIKETSALTARDSIRFTLNGKAQFVQLEAIAQEAVKWYGKVFDQDTTLTADKPYLVFDSLVINEGVTLTIDKGVKLHFRKDVTVQVKGRINAIGTIEEPIVFRGDRYDNILTDVPYNHIPGQWGGIEVDSVSYQNVFENVQIRNTNFGIIFRPSTSDFQKARFYNTTVLNSLENGMSAINCHIEASNSLFANAKNSTLWLYGGSYSFVHCTVVNYLSWRSISPKAIITAGSLLNDLPTPIQQCNFYNCLFFGKTKNLDFKDDNLYPLKYRFENCLINQAKKDDTEHYLEIVWNKDPMFVYLNEDYDQFYNFRLDSASAAINIGKPEFAQSLQLDMDGNSRLSDVAPDAGCFEWVKKQPTLPLGIKRRQLKAVK